MHIRRKRLFQLLITLSINPAEFAGISFKLQRSGGDINRFCQCAFLQKIAACG
jgi:hypothetical protein